ncbi:MAG: 2-oxoacid:ferredoxin oxidoreductase subunit beta [Euryarchaeota archaeon]|nr:2-oxoacid:ferredoxin oxidoreductase subunit beta [Euryarchaeota archaeon]
MMAGEGDGRPEHPLARYLRPGTLPSTFCPGCGCGTVLNCFLRAVDRRRLDPSEIIMVTGIGCASWIPSPMFRCDTLHTTHGRAVAFATGVKLMMPRKKVLIIAGDGDLAGIGGNHLIHAAHRNIDLGVMMVNNRIYGMTGGQCSPTTPSDRMTTTTPFGNLDRPVLASELLVSAGANHVARWTTFHVRQLSRAMEELLDGEGFRFLEIVSQCPTHYDKEERLSAAEALERYRDGSVPVAQAGEPYDGETGSKLTVGVLVDRKRDGYIRRLEASERGLSEAGGTGKGRGEGP